MKTPKNFKRLLRNCLQSDIKGIITLILTYAKVANCLVYYEQDFIVCILHGENDVSLPLVCAHYDTVNVDKTIVVIEENGLLRNEKAEPIGGDDRAGVAIALSLMQDKIPAIYCFFDEEESGCGGSRSFCNMYADLIKSSSCYIGLDRRGNTDAAVYDTTSAKLMEIVSEYGYKKEDGTMTDVSLIESKFPKATVNLSVGFTSEHTAKERLNQAHAYKTYKSMISIIPKVSGVVFNDLQTNDYFGFYSKSGVDYYDDVSYFGYQDGNVGLPIPRSTYFDRYNDEEIEDDPSISEYYQNYATEQDKKDYADKLKLIRTSPYVWEEVDVYCHGCFSYNAQKGTCAALFDCISLKEMNLMAIRN